MAASNNGTPARAKTETETSTKLENIKGESMNTDSKDKVINKV